MKQALLLLLCLTVLTTVLPLTALASEAAPETTPRNYTEYTNTFWDIPWGVSYDEFHAAVMRQKNLYFMPTGLDARYALANPEKFSFLGEPVRRFDVFFDFYSHRFSTVADPFIFIGNLKETNSLQDICIEFSPQVANPDVNDYINQFSRLIKALYNQYGDPGLTCLEPCHCAVLESKNLMEVNRTDFFTMPVISGVLQPETLLKAIQDPYDLVVVRMAFDNRVLTFAYCPFEGAETCKIRLYIHNSFVIFDYYDFDNILYTDFIPRPDDF